MNEQAKVIPLPQYEECDCCWGTGMIKYNPVYINGDLYQDGEVLECDECQGLGKIKIQGEE